MNQTMNKRAGKLAAGLAVLLLAAGVNPAQATTDAKAEYLTANNKAAYSVMMANAGIAKGASASTVVLVRNDNLADALSATALAGNKRGTILSVPNNGSLPGEYKTNLQNAKNVFIMGGAGAIGASMEQNLKAVKDSLQIQRVQGANRFGTAAAAAALIGKNNVARAGNLDLNETSINPPVVPAAIVVNGYAFADGVTAGPLAYGAGVTASAGQVFPILLVNKDSVPEETMGALTDLGIERVIIVGGRGVVSEDAERDLLDAGVSHISHAAGADRFDSSAQFASVAIQTTDIEGSGWTREAVGVADLSNAGGGHDALIAAPYFGITRTPLVGVGSQLSTYVDDYLANNNYFTKKVSFVSSTGGINRAVTDAVMQTVKSVSAE